MSQGGSMSRAGAAQPQVERNRSTSGGGLGDHEAAPTDRGSWADKGHSLELPDDD